MIRRDREEGRIDHLACEFSGAQFSSRRAKTAQIGALAVSLALAVGLAVMHVFETGISADVDEIVIALGEREVASQEHNQMQHEAEHPSSLLSQHSLHSSSLERSQPSLSLSQERWTIAPESARIRCRPAHRSS